MTSEDFNVGKNKNNLEKKKLSLNPVIVILDKEIAESITTQLEGLRGTINDLFPEGG
jgi:hypothetical protein